MKLSFKFFLFVFYFALCVNVSAITPANPNSNDNVKKILNLFSSLKYRTDHKLISGQFIGYNNVPNNYQLISDIYDSTGKWIGLVGSDYADWTTDNQVIKYNNTNTELIKAWKEGSLVCLQVHMPNPANPDGGGLWDTNVDLNQLLTPGSDTYTRWIKEMDTIAAGLNQLQDSGVVVLFRPFHEMNGAWFWWGGKNTKLFVKMWEQLFNYFTYAKKLNNLLWVFGPNINFNPTSYYPGSVYVDIIGLDAYTSEITASGIGGYSSMVNLNKPFGLTEFGPENPSSPSGNFDYRILVNGLKKNMPEICFFLCWDWKWGLKYNKYVKEALDDNYIANRDDIDWQNQPIIDEIKESNLVGDVTVYPNPVENNGILTLKFKDITKQEEIKVEIYDILGNVALQQKLINTEYNAFKITDLHTLQKGMHFIKIKSQTYQTQIPIVVK